MSTYEFQGTTLTISETDLVIQRQKVAGLSLSKEWRIPRAAVSGARYVEPSTFKPGYLQIHTHGTDPGTLKAVELLTDQNTLPVGKKHIETAMSLEMWLHALADHNTASGDFTAWQSRGPAERQLSRKEVKHHDIETYGQCVEKGTIGITGSVKIYDKGYVKIGGLHGTFGRYEELVDIQASVEVSGRSKQGEVYLTITTTQDVYPLHDRQPGSFTIKTAKKLEAVGKGVAGRAGLYNVARVSVPAYPDPAPAATPAASDFTTQLAALAQLRAQGMLSDDEFQDAKHRLFASERV